MRGESQRRTRVASPQKLKLILPEIIIPTDGELRSGLKVEKSLIEGLGLFADRDFKTNQVIWSEPLKGRVGRPESDGPLRWANHSDNPNSILLLGADQIPAATASLIAIRTILKGQEIVYSYGVFGHTGYFKTCKCGEPNCQGVFILREEWGEKK